jgi:hypothetical protein
MKKWDRSPGNEWIGIFVLNKREESFKKRRERKAL